MHRIDRMQETLHRFQFHHLRTCRLRLQFQQQVGLCHRILILQLCLEHIQFHAHSLFFRHRHRTYGIRLTRNGIVQVTAVNLTQTQVAPVQETHQVTVQQLVRIRTVLVDVISRVTAGQSLHCHTEKEITFWSRYHRTRIYRSSSRTSGTTDKEFSVVFRIQINQDISIHETFFQCKRTCQARFLIHRKQTLQRSVLHIVRSQHRQFGRHTDTIVGTQRSTLCLEPFSVDIRLNRILLKIVFRILILFADHIHMRLQNHCLQMLLARSRRFYNQYVSCLIHLILKSSCFRKIHQISPDLLLLFRRTGHLTDFFKIPEQDGRFQIFFFHKISNLSFFS